MAKFKQAPLPFNGQKRMFLKHFEAVLEENIPNDGEGWTIIDVFGGSGLLSHSAKCKKPLARVIYNDFDGYAERLKHIADINRLRQQIYATIGESIPKEKRLSKEKKAEIINIIKAFDGFIDLNSLSSWLLFSGQQVNSLEALLKKDFWHCVRKTDYPEATGYLDDVEIVSESFHQLLPRFQGKEKVLLVLDPPYLYTKQESYRQANYFDLIDFLRLISLITPPYILFSSTKSEFVRFIEYVVQGKKENWQAFEGAKRLTVNAALNYRTKYEDNLVYKFF